MRKINAVVMTLAGSLLIVAAILKAHEVLTVYFPSWREHGVWESWEFFLVQVPVEFALGVWMVSGLFRKAAWAAGTVAYIGFIGVTLYKALAGIESCGCFGRVEVDPWITLFAIDVPFALLLLIFRPKGLKLFPPPWPNLGHALATAVPIFAALIFTAPLLVAFRPEFIQPEDWTDQRPAVVRPIVTPTPVEPPEPVILEPEPDTEPEQDPEHQLDPTPQPKPDVVTPDPVPDKPEPDKDPEVIEEPDTPTEPQGDLDPDEKPDLEPEPEPDTDTKPDPEAEAEPEPESEPDAEPEPEAAPLWPWLDYVDEQTVEQLKEGIVVVYMYHYDCSICADSVPKYEAYSQEMAEMGMDAFRIAYLAIPPYGKGPVPDDTTALHGRLSDQRRWAVTSPFVVALLEGSVVKQWPQGTAPEPDTILDEIFGP